jgi:hypothetical protein
MSRDTSPVRERTSNDQTERTPFDPVEVEWIRRLFMDEYFTSKKAAIVRKALYPPICVDLSRCGKSMNAMRDALVREQERDKLLAKFLTGPAMQAVRAGHDGRSSDLIHQGIMRGQRIDELIDDMKALAQERLKYK